MKQVAFLVIGFFSLTGCKNSQVLLFQNIPENEVQTSIPEILIKKGDLLDITISSLNNKSVEIFSPVNPNQIVTRNLESRKLDGYLVDNYGFIEMPIIGKIKAEGLTCLSLSTTIQNKLEEFITSPFVRSNISNFRVSIFGEISRPGTYSVSNQNISLPELISRAGGLTNSADRKNIIVVRNFNDKVYREYIDFTSYDFFNSNYYYLQQNDQVFVSPTRVSSYLEYGFLRNVGVLSLITSILILIRR